MANRRSLPVTGFPLPGLESSSWPLYVNFLAAPKRKKSGVQAARYSLAVSFVSSFPKKKKTAAGPPPFFFGVFCVSPKKKRKGGPPPFFSFFFKKRGPQRNG